MMKSIINWLNSEVCYPSFNFQQTGWWLNVGNHSLGIKPTIAFHDQTENKIRHTQFACFVIESDLSN